MDSNYQDEQSLTCTSEGVFSFDTRASELGIFAITPDGKAAGSIVTNELISPIQLRLLPTGEYQGQLFAVGHQPAVNHPVYVYIRLEGSRAGNARFAKIADVKRIETKTDEHGNYTLKGIPPLTKAMIFADAIDGTNDSVYIDEAYLEPNESRPRTVKSLVRTAVEADPVPLAKRYQAALRDCALGGFRPLIIIADDSEGAMRFVDQNYANYEANEDVYPFMQIIVTGGKIPLDPADEELLKARHWPLPQPGRVVALALDAEGKELGRQDVDIAQPTAARDAADFIHEHAPAPQNAEEKWTAAFAEAKRTNRSVWARVSQRYCGPCFRMSRWLDDQRALLEKDYVMLKVDDVRDINGEDVAQHIVRGQQVGIPFHAIFDESGTLLVDSNGPLGNIGSPDDTEGIKHLRTMLTKTRRSLTDAEIDLLVESASK
jgi:hypothetical protein